MPSGFRKTAGNGFKITYEAPWGGVASNADPLDIQDNQFVIADGAVDIAGRLSQMQLVASSGFKFVPYGAQVGEYPSLFFTVGNFIFCLDNFGLLYNVNFASTGAVTITSTGAIKAPDYPWTAPADDLKIVNQIVYISHFGNHSIYTYNLHASSGSPFLLASNYVGGRILGMLDGYLLQLNCNSIGDGIQNIRVNWSGPGLFSTWDPSVNRTAGYNTLTDISTQITGFISLASVGIIITDKSLIEVSPTGIAIQPFNFTVLWTSEIGQGSTYPSTVKQYGQLAYMANSDGIYKVSTGGLQDICGAAKRAIFSSFMTDTVTSSIKNTSQGVTQLAGNILQYFYNDDSPEQYYVFATTTVHGRVNTNVNLGSLHLWMFNISTGVWYNSNYDISTLLNDQSGPGITAYFVSSLKISVLSQVQNFLNPSNLSNLPVFIIHGFAGVPFTFVLQTTAETANPNFMTTGTNLALVFKAHEIEVGNQPTIRRVLIKASGSGTLDISVGLTSFGSITLNNAIVQTYKTSIGVYTGESPQLTITSSNFQGIIVKVQMLGAFGDGEID